MIHGVISVLTYSFSVGIILYYELIPPILAPFAALISVMIVLPFLHRISFNDWRFWN